MRLMHVAVLALLVLSAVCLAQWSEPVSISDTAFNYPEGFQLAAGAGDTLWALYETGDSTGMHMVCHWSTGDSWSAPEILASGILWFYPASGVDPLGRVWIAWTYTIPMPLGDTLGILACVHDSSGWDTAHLVIPLGGMCHLGFAADKHSIWYMGFSESGGLSTNFYSYAAYSRFQANRWQQPKVIASGHDSLHYGLPSLVARPDTGLWAVYSEGIYGVQQRVLVDHLIPDSALIHRASLFDLAGWTATGDSAGQMWIIYVDTLGAVRSITYGVEGEKRRQLVTDNHRWVAPQVCTDAEGWVWALWARSDTSLVMSCNWGNHWSEPELVTTKIGYPVDIVSDRHGRVYVCFRDTQGKYWTCYRTSRPGIGNDADVERPAIGCQASVVRALRHEPVVFDAMGRRVLNPRSGIFFVREAPAVGGQPSAVTKVVITR